MITIQEHQKIDPEKLAKIDPDYLKRRVNYDTSQFVASRINLIRYEFNPAENRDGFYSYYRIGAEWLDEDQTRSIVVTPKITNIDFIDMFMTCLQTAESTDRFSSIYDIDFAAKPIHSCVLSSILSPLLVIQYLVTMKRISTHGLRKGYVVRNENLGKIKGRIDIRRNEMHNTINGHRERVFCRYDDYSVDTPENRLLKKALVVSYNMISMMADHHAYVALSAMCNHCLSVFSEVKDVYDGNLPIIKANKLYYDYNLALRFAIMILRRQEMSITKRNEALTDIVPVFRVDMALLFEHYVLAKLRKTFGYQSIIYQAKGGNRFVADFLISKGKFKAIVDTKYINGEGGNTVAKGDYVKQLSGYARDKSLLQALGIECDDEDRVPIIPCILLYPSTKNMELTEKALLDYKLDNTIKFYTAKLTIPTIDND